jgi:hypothetical protein
VRRAAGEGDDRALERSPVRAADTVARWTGRDSACVATRLDQAVPAVEATEIRVSSAPTGCSCPSELDAQGQHHAGDVAAAEDGVAAGDGEQRTDGVALRARRACDLPPPRLVDTIEPRPARGLLVAELVVQRAPRV